MSERCPYQDICATTVYHREWKKDFIKSICETKEHKNCRHFVGLDVNPSMVEDVRKRGMRGDSDGSNPE